ncbi:FkbM family methyltransferase [Rhizobium rhizogenes]|uniref:FkbM family methyltransferase n=1 Tax=Rhizobium rhizogenes TaxID=359 RepID=UPI0015731B1E|nr:FkbM family methyltransferase [Rhizobium rhizogenes]NTI27681.1 FkbM family methyltransferase [Rhizobium rhizogenes]
MNDVDTIYKKEFPSGTIELAGSSEYAAHVGLPALSHLTIALERYVGKLPAPICLDIGANIGATSILMDQLLSNGKIFAFEPHPKTYRQLERNIASNKSGNNEISLFPLALGKEKTALKFRDIDQYNTGNSFLIDGSLAERAQSSISVTVDRLDNLNIAPGHRINLAKIDVEGFEIDVLKGGVAAFYTTDLVLLEFNHWCLTSLARTFPEDALSAIFSNFRYVHVYDHATQSYRRIASDAEKWSFLHSNMVKNNVDDLLCTNLESVTAAFA